MKKLPTYIIFSLTFIILFSCGQMNKHHNSRTGRIVQTGTGKILPINYSDTNYIDLQSSTIDTTTRDGWSIKYLIKDDSTKYNDIYIECSKGDYKGQFYGADLLQFRRYFIPSYIGETNSHIYFWHGCATDCSAILTFSKDSLCKFKDYQDVVNYNIKFGQILYVADKTYKNEDSIYELALVDINRNKIHKIVYKNICMNVFKVACVDTVIFSKNQVTITTTLTDKETHMKNIKETRVIKIE